MGEDLVLTDSQKFQRVVKAAAGIEPLDGMQTYFETDSEAIIEFMKLIEESRAAYNILFKGRQADINGWTEPEEKIELVKRFLPKEMLVTIDPLLRDTHIILYTEERNEYLVLSADGCAPNVTGEQHQALWFESRQKLGIELLTTFQTEVVDPLRLRHTIEAPVYSLFSNGKLRIYPDIYFSIGYDPKTQRPGRIKDRICKSLESCIALPYWMETSRLVENGERELEVSVMFEIP